MTNQWDARLHPRGEHGRFRPVDSRDVAASTFPLQRLSSARLSRLFAAALDEPVPAQDAFDRIAAELGRRDEIRAQRPISDWVDLLLADRRKGETRRQAMRRAYDEWVYLRYLRAETATRGHLLTSAGVAAGISAVSLFEGQHARANRWASEDLKRWWDGNGGRVTFTAFCANPPVASLAEMAY